MLRLSGNEHISIFRWFFSGEILYICDILGLSKCEPYIHMRKNNNLPLLGLPAPSGCQRTQKTIEFGVVSNAVELLSNTAQRANASILDATGGLFI